MSYITYYNEEKLKQNLKKKKVKVIWSDPQVTLSLVLQNDEIENQWIYERKDQ